MGRPRSRGVPRLSNKGDSGGLQALFSAAGWYAAAALLQRGANLLLIPFYTRVIEPAEYGVLELLTAFSGILFTFLTLGLASAVNKCLHRDCETEEEQARVLPTALAIDLPVLAIAGFVIVFFSEPIARVLLGDSTHASLIPLVAGQAICFGAGTVALSALRAQQRPGAFVAISLTQFAIATTLNVTLVLWFDLGIRGILWGNFISNAVALPLGIFIALRGSALQFDKRLVRPLMGFGLALVPGMLAAWVIDGSDRYLLRLYRPLQDVAVYGIGYKFGMLLEIGLVWPFQLAWPAFAFAASKRSGYRPVYARTLTYMTAASALLVVGISLIARQIVGLAVGPEYQAAYLVIPAVALAYALNGTQYCLAPGVHVAGYTRYLPALAGAGAVANIGLNLLLIPTFGTLGAAWSTTAAFAVIAGGTVALAHRVHPIPYEFGRIARILVCALVVLTAGYQLDAGEDILTLLARGTFAVVAFPTLLVLTGFVAPDEWESLRKGLGRFPPFASEKA